MKKILVVLVSLITAAVLACSAAYPVIVAKYGNTEGTENIQADRLIISAAENQKKQDEKDIRIMSANLQADYEGFGGTEVSPRASVFLSVRGAFEPDVIAVQEMSFRWYCCLQNSKGRYRMVHPLSTFLKMKMTGIIYNSEILRLIESGDEEFPDSDDFRTRRIVWARFSQRSSGKTFIIVSTHLSFPDDKNGVSAESIKKQGEILSDRVQELRQEYDCPVIIAGDFNARETKSGDPCGIYAFLSSKYFDTRIKSAKYYYGSEKKPGSLLNDHIFISGNAQSIYYSLLSVKCLSGMSDHYPIFTDVRL